MTAGVSVTPWFSTKSQHRSRSTGFGWLCISSMKSTSDEEMSVEKSMCLIVCYTLIIAVGGTDATRCVPLCQLVRMDNPLGLCTMVHHRTSTPNVDPSATSFCLLSVPDP